MNNILVRTGLLLLHAVANIALIAYLTKYDISSSWLFLISFLVILFVLLVLFIRHIAAFINFIKTKPK